MPSILNDRLKLKVFVVFFLIVVPLASFAQINSGTTPLIRNDASIKLDGLLDESVWQDIPVSDGMKVVDPDTLIDASLKTHKKIFYNQRGIYVGVKNFQQADTLIARMTSRDTRLDRDAFIIGIDPSGEGLYGYIMRINLGGSMTDATLLPERQWNLQWDGSWNAVTAVVEDGWTAEIFIPWSMMALPQTGETRQIGIYTERMVAHLGETWSSPALPQTNNEFISAFQRYELRGINPRKQLTFYPYISTTLDDIKSESEARVGADIYWRPFSNTQLSATLNPDFGNVESDDIVVNLGAFETFFPEKRAFFQEGQDVFNTSPRSTRNRGPGGPTSMLNTRRIGGQALFTVPSDVDIVATDLSQPTDLLGAAKLTGQNGNWRYGTLLAAEDDSEITGTLTSDGSRVRLEAEGRDFAVARLLYEDTNNGGRRSIGWMGTNVSHTDIDATVNGVDLHYFSADTKWVIDGQLLHSDVDDVTGAGAFADIAYRPSRGVQHAVSASYLDDELDINELGFISRNDYIQLDYNFSINESNIKGLRNRNRRFQIFNQWNTDSQPTRLGIFYNHGWRFLDNTSLNWSVRYFPPRVDDRLSRGNGSYKILSRWAANINWQSDQAKPLSYGVGVNPGVGDLGENKFSLFSQVNWRPSDRFSLVFSLNHENRDAWLVYQSAGNFTTFKSKRWAPRLNVNYFISAKQQFRASLQWTGIKAKEENFYAVNANDLDYLTEISKPTATPDDFTISRLAFQARYRWEIAPLSDLFFVYTRGGNLDRDTTAGFGGLYQQAWNEKIVSTWVIKLRYRLGS